MTLSQFHALWRIKIIKVCLTIATRRETNASFLTSPHRVLYHIIITNIYINPLKSELFTKQACRDASVVYIPFLILISIPRSAFTHRALQYENKNSCVIYYIYEYC